MSYLREIINKNSSTGKLAKTLNYTHRNSLNYRLNNPGSISVEMLNSMAEALKVNRRSLLEAIDLELLEIKEAAKKAARKKK